MAEYWTRDGPRVVVRLPAGIVRVVFGGLVMLAGVVVLVAVSGRALGFGSAEPPFVLADALKLAVFGAALLALGFVVAFHRQRVVIDGTAGTATFLHDFGFFKRERVVPLAQFSGVKVDHRAAVGARALSHGWYWVCLTGKGTAEDVVALGSSEDAEALRRVIAGVLRDRV